MTGVDTAGAPPPASEAIESAATPTGLVPPGFLFGVATAGFQVEGGFNGPGEPANNWLEWEVAGRVEPSGDAVGFWRRPEVALDRAASLGCDSFRLSVEWPRICPAEGTIDRAALDRYAAIVRGCTARGMVPLVTVHHFTHPDWLGTDFWLRPDAPSRYRAYAEVVVDALAADVRHWVTINEINVLAMQSWLLGTFPPGRFGALGDVAVAIDQLLAAHVAGYEVIHRARPDALVTTNNASLTLYEYDRMLTDVLLARSIGVEKGNVPEWLAERRRSHDRGSSRMGGGRGLAEASLRRVSALLTPSPATGARLSGRVGNRRPLGRAVDAVYESACSRTLDALSLDWYDPVASRHFRLPGHRSSGGRNPLPVRELWDDVPDPARLRRWVGDVRGLAGDLPVWVVENGLCNRVRNGRSYPRLDGWDRCRYLGENLSAVVSAMEEGVPVTGYWHWSLVDNYEWGSYEPRFGIHGVDRHRGDGGGRWLETDSLGQDAAAAYRSLITGLRSGDRSVLVGG